MAYIHYFTEILEKTNNVNIFKFVILVFLYFVIFSLVADVLIHDWTSVKRIKRSCFYGFFCTFIYFNFLLWIDIARFYSINKILAFFAFLALLIGIVAIMRAVKKRRKKKSVVVAAPPPMGKAVLGDVESEEKEKK